MTKAKQEEQLVMTPIGKRVLIKRIEESSQSAGGLFIPDSSKEKPTKGRVVEVGSTCELGLQKGDLVLFGKFSGSEVKIKGEEYVIILEDEILLKVSE